MIKRLIASLLRSAGYELIRVEEERPRYPEDFTAADIAVIERVKPYTVVSPERIITLRAAVKYIWKNSIPGSIVECGVWKGGCMMAVAYTLLELGDATRDLYLFDTFEGMSEPSEKDVDFTGANASELLASQKKGDDYSLWCYASFEEVTKNMMLTGYPQDRIHFVKGKVEETLPMRSPEAISLLRLDTDWYESTLHELIHLYPRLSGLGLLIIDDYGHWRGAQKAIDEFFEQFDHKPLLHRIDYTGRLLVKV